MKKRSEEEREEKFKPCFRKVLEKWLGPKDNWEEEFDSIDMTNKKGEGNVLFRVKLEERYGYGSLLIDKLQEFFDWAIHKNIDYQGDMGVNLE